MDYRKTVERLREKAEIFKKSNYAVDGVVKCFEESADTIEQLTEELKQLKDKPFQINPGDTVYCLRKAVPTEYHNFTVDKWLETDNEIIPARVVNIKVLKSGIYFKVALKGKCFIKGMHDGEMTTSEDYEYCTFNMRMGAIGITVFLTEAEAEEALAKMGGK